MNYRLFGLVGLVCVGVATCLAQVEADSTDTSGSGGHYQFHLSFAAKKDTGYGIIVGFHGGVTDRAGPFRSVYELGIARTQYIHADDPGQSDVYLSFELNRLSTGTLYGFVLGGDVKFIFIDMGMALNYMTNFSGWRALSIRPFVGVTLWRFGNVDAVIEPDISILKPNFDIISHWMLGIRTEVQFLDRGH